MPGSSFTLLRHTPFVSGPLMANAALVMRPSTLLALLKAGKLDLHPVITDKLAMKDFNQGMERLKTGEASKILLYPNGTR